MGKLGINDVKTGGGTPKTLQPGNYVCTINGVSLKPFEFKEGGYHLVLEMEGPDMGPDFEGFFIDKDKPDLGRHHGQVGSVKAGEWAFADGKTKSGIPIHRDNEIIKFIKNLCEALECMEWPVAQDKKHDTIEQFVEAFAKDAPFKGKALRVCLCGREYVSKGGFTNHELFFPKFTKTGVPFESASVVKTRLIKFNEADHIRKKKVENVQEFEADPGLESTTQEDFKL